VDTVSDTLVVSGCDVDVEYVSDVVPDTAVEADAVTACDCVIDADSDDASDRVAELVTDSNTDAVVDVVIPEGVIVRCVGVGRVKVGVRVPAPTQNAVVARQHMTRTIFECSPEVIFWAG
jgi:hypothetical protein